MIRISSKKRKNTIFDIFTIIRMDNVSLFHRKLRKELTWETADKEEEEIGKTETKISQKNISCQKIIEYFLKVSKKNMNNFY